MSGLFGGNSSPSNAPIIYSGLNVSSSQWNMPVALFWGQRRLSTNAIDYDNFQKHSQSAKGKGGGKGGQNYTYSADVLIALSEGAIESMPRIWADGSTTTTTTLSALNMTFFDGTQTAPWSYWSTNHSSKARSYRLTAYIGAPNLDLGYSATIPDNAFECVRAAGFSYTHTTPGWIDPNSHTQYDAIDCLLSDIIPDFLTNVQYGMGWTSADLGDLAQFAAYQRAQGLFFSPLLNTQTKATEVINRWAQLANSWIYWSGTQLQFVPLGDAAVTGNGVTFTPHNDVAYDLEFSDLVAGDNEPLVKISRKDPADCYNTTRLSIVDRTLGYVDNPFEYKDDQLVDLYGRRDNTSIQGDDICDPLVGQVVVQLVGKRAAYLRNTYSFKTSYRFILCLPGTILTIPLNFTGQRARVRVVEISEDEQGALSFTCEEFPGTIGTYVAPLATPTPVTSTLPNFLGAPPSVNTPAVIEPPASFTGGVARLIVAASGGQFWGGCSVYLSFDGMDYSKIGEITSPAKQGVLTASLASYGGANPDTGHTLSVDCTQSFGAPATVSHADADALRTLSLVAAQPSLSASIYTVPTNGELLAFGDVSVTGTYTADLSYLQRGEYGTNPGSHLSGDQFTVINVLGSDGTSIAFDLPKQYIGQTLHLKLASFNWFQKAEQDLSLCAEYVYTPTGAGYGTGTAGAPAAPTGLTVTPTSYGNNGVGWTANPASDNVTSYSIYRAPGPSGSFGAASLVWTGSALAFVDVNVTSGADYTYFVDATNSVGTSSPSAGVDATAVSGAITTGSATTISLTGAVDGVNTTFTMGSSLALGAIPLLSVNGTYQAYSTDYSISGTTLTFVTAPPSGATLDLSSAVVSLPNLGFIF